MSRRRTWASDIEEAFEPKRKWNNQVRKHIELETEAVEDLKRLLLERFPSVHIEAYLEEKVKPHTKAIYGLLVNRLSKRQGPYSFVAVLTEIHGIVASKFGMFSTSQRERAEAEHNPAFRHLTVAAGGANILERKYNVYRNQLLPLLELDENIVERLKAGGGDVREYARLLLDLASVYARFNEFFVNNSLTLEEAIGPAAFSQYYNSPPWVEPTLLQRGEGGSTKADRSRLWTAVAQRPAEENVIVIDDDEAPVGPYHPLVLGYAPRPQTYAGMFKKP